VRGSEERKSVRKHGAEVESLELVEEELVAALSLHQPFVAVPLNSQTLQILKNIL
jgi:hypothetical protein